MRTPRLPQRTGLALALGLSLIAASCGGTTDTVVSGDGNTSGSATDSSATDAGDTDSESAEAESNPDAGADADESAAPAGDSAEVAADPRFSGEFPTIDQATFDLASLQGQDAVLWFWAPW